LKQLLTDEDTLYIGSRASERFFRAYNKGAQEKMDYNWLRLELECKKLMAQAVGNAIAEHDDTRVVINRAIRDYVEFPRLDELNAALQQADVEIPRPSRKIHSTYRWLMETVAPAIARYQFEHPGEDIESSFVTLWRHHLAELRKRAAQGNV
jgi:DNA relaxase NicK